MKIIQKSYSTVFLLAVLLPLTAGRVVAEDDSSRNILKQGLLGAGVGAISASASGGKAGKGALIGAGTNVIGGALLDTLTSGPSQPQPQYAPQPVEYVQQPVYVQRVPAYAPPQDDPNKKILKQGLLGAGTGAIAAGASGGNAGKGALIGAGTNVIGGALLDTLTSGPSQPQPQPVYYQPAPQYQQPTQVSQQAPSGQLHKKIIRKYDSDGHVVSEEEVWQ